jgi:hypothetical protein
VPVDGLGPVSPPEVAEATPAQRLAQAADMVESFAADPHWSASPAHPVVALAPSLAAWLRMASREYRSREGMRKWDDPPQEPVRLGESDFFAPPSPVDLTGMRPSYWTVALECADAILAGGVLR